MPLPRSPATILVSFRFDLPVGMEGKLLTRCIDAAGVVDPGGLVEPAGARAFHLTEPAMCEVSIVQ